MESLEPTMISIIAIIFGVGVAVILTLLIANGSVYLWNLLQSQI